MAHAAWSGHCCRCASLRVDVGILLGVVQVVSIYHFNIDYAINDYGISIIINDYGFYARGSPTGLSAFQFAAARRMRIWDLRAWDPWGRWISAGSWTLVEH